MLPSRARRNGSGGDPREGPLLVQPAAGIDRRHADHADPRGPYGLPSGRDDHQRPPGEGKTSLASHLATSLARSGLRTLLIDADLRNPSTHRLFELTPDPGLSEVLRGEAALEDVVATTAIDELNVITAGKCDHQTLRILSQGGMGSLFARLKDQYDFVIVDSSPILPVADALIIAQQVDAVLFSVLTDVSRKAQDLRRLPAARRPSASGSWARS